MAQSKMRVLRIKETRLLNFLPERFLRTVNSALMELFGKEIIRLSSDDKLRLLTLRVWMERHHVDLMFILQSIVPYHASRIRRRKGGDPRALGFKIPTLVGKMSENLLKEAIEKEFENGENHSLYRWEKIQEIIKQRTEDELSNVGKSLTDYRSVSKYVAAYKRRVQGRQKVFQKELNRKTNSRRHYRGSPWLT